MGREIRIIWAGRHQRDSWEDLCSDYRKRIARHTPVVDQPIRVPTSGDDQMRQQKESAKLLAASPQPAWHIALDSGGKTMSSEKWATALTQIRRDWAHPISFFIGSDLGLAPEVIKGARLVLSFGPMTLPHTLARLVLYEQIYRAISIEAGINYHRPRF